MITIRVTIEHDDETQGEPRNVMHEAMVETATGNADLDSVVTLLAKGAVEAFTVLDRITRPPFDEFAPKKIEEPGF